MFIIIKSEERNLSFEEKSKLFDKKVEEFFKLYDVIVKINRIRLKKYIKLNREAFLNNFEVEHRFDDVHRINMKNLSIIVNRAVEEVGYFQRKRRRKIYRFKLQK